MSVLFFFVFKQETAYEMRISDWSSDVCSSDLLIDAYERSDCTAKLVIAGSADHASEYARELLERASDRVIFAGVQSRATLKCLYEHCALFVMPSYHEGLPIAALDAARSGARHLLRNIPAHLVLGLNPSTYVPFRDDPDHTP